MNHDEPKRANDAEWADLEPAEQARQLFADSLLERLHQGADPQLQDKLRAAFDQLEEPAPAGNVPSFTRGFGRQLAAAASLIVGLGVLLFLIGGPGASSAEAMLERARANASSGELRSFEILREWPSLNAEKRIGLLHLGESGEYSVVIEGDYGPCRMGRRGGEHWKHGPMERFGGRGGERREDPRGEPERSERPDHPVRPGGRGSGGDPRGPLTDWLNTNGVELPYATLEEMVGLFDEGYTLEVVSVRTADGDVREGLIAVAEGEAAESFPPRPDRIELQLGRAETGIEELRLYWSDAPRFGRRSGDSGRRNKGEREDNDGHDRGPRGGDRRSPWESMSSEDFNAFLSKRHPEWVGPDGQFDFEGLREAKFSKMRGRLGLPDSVTYEQFKEADSERSIVLRLLDEAPSAEVFEPVEIEPATDAR
ncbi:MAG: hypothetical protein ACYTFV_09665 [Planctomycetota bacterium]|jgi:hypothetical protein